MGSLSQDMKLGAMLTKQGHGLYLGENGSTCAVGAVLAARGIPVFDAIRVIGVHCELNALTKDPLVWCPGVCGVVTTVGNTVVHLNDWHRWSRERIADWIATLEQARDQQAPDAQPALVTV